MVGSDLPKTPKQMISEFTMIIRIPPRQATKPVAIIADSLPVYLLNDEPLFPLLMNLWLDQSLPIPSNQNQAAA